MKYRVPVVEFTAALIVMFSIQVCPAQEKQTALSFFIGGDYYSPNLDGVNAIYQTIEKNYSLPPGTAFKNYYSIMTGIRYSPVAQQSIQFEFGGSVFKSDCSGQNGGNWSASFLSMYYIGGTYLFHIPSKHINFFIGGGPGYVWLNSERTYSVVSGIAQVDGQLAQLHCIGGIDIDLPMGAILAIEAGYSYATTLFPVRSDLDFVFKSPTGGIQICIPILKISTK